MRQGGRGEGGIKGAVYGGVYVRAASLLLISLETVLRCKRTFLMLKRFQCGGKIILLTIQEFEYISMWKEYMTISV